MTRRIAAALVCVLTVSACGMSAGLRPIDDGTGVQALAAPDNATGTIPPTTIITEVAGVVVTSNVAPPVPTSTTIDDGSTTGIEAVETTTTEVAETTTTTVAGTTTTSADVPPSTIVDLPDFDDIGTVFDEDGAFVSHDCAGGDVTINGDAGTFTLEGDCGSLLIKGSFNTVFVDSIQAIDLTGTLNAVVHGPGSPTVNDWDGENIVTGG